MTKKTKITIAAVAAALVTIIAAFTIYVSYYAVGQKALPGTKVGEVKVSGLTAKQINKQLATAETKYRVTFSGHGVREKSLTPKEIGYQVDSAETARKATARSSAFNYVSSLFTTRQIPIKHQVDAQVTSKLSHELTKDIKGAKPVTEPSVQLNAEGTGFSAVPGKDGFGADTKRLLAGADKVMASQKNQRMPLTMGAVKPLVDFKLAQKLADAAEKFIQPQVAIKAGDKEIVADQKVKVSFVDIPAVTRHAKPTTNDDAVADWVNKNKEAVEVKKVNGQRLVNSAGKVLRTKIASKDGVAVTNGDQLAKEISSNFAAGKDSSLAFETKVDKASNEDQVIPDASGNIAYKAAPGEKWIDVNLSNYTVTGYEGTVVAVAPTSMVPGAPATPTIQGTFSIKRKLRFDTMRGPGYVTPNVPYAMYFHGGYALHGAYWRSSFGWGGPGGSHGCVDLPVSEAAEFYNWAPIGTVVVTHH